MMMGRCGWWRRWLTTIALPVRLFRRVLCQAQFVLGSIHSVKALRCSRTVYAITTASIPTWRSMGSTDDLGQLLGPFILVVVIMTLVFVIVGAITPGYGLPGSRFSNTVSDVTSDSSTSANESTESNSSINTTGEYEGTAGDQGAFQETG
jgi:hypothetical protein